MPAPTDQPARDRIHHDLDTTLFVEAGAGTGKTRELIERIVRLVASGHAELRQIAAITFTEAAAAELRDRVRLRLEQAITEDSGGEDILSPEERERCHAALPQLEAAAIETLHGFAQRILTTHPLEAGLPPVLEIQDDVHATIAFDERWTAFLDELLSNDALEDTLLRAFVLGLQPEHLCQLAQELHRHWDRLVEPAAETTVAPPPIDASELIGLLADACDKMPRCQERSDPLYQHLERVEAYRNRLAAAESELDTLRILGEPAKVSTGGGRKENWQGVTPSEIRDALKEAQQLREELLAEARAALLPPLLAELTRFILAYAGERRQQGRLEFHDLLVQARNLLRSDSAVRQQVRTQFTHLLIDEFQDTDPLQIEIAALLAGSDDEDEPPDWQDAKIEPGRLFFVGDPKQSIYRFRRADIGLYQQAQRQFVEGEVKLTQNFRSVEPVIAWLNHVFEDLMGDEPADGQAAYVPLAASWPALDSGAPSVRLIGGPADENIGPIRAREANELVRAIQAAKSEGWPVTETDAGGERRTRNARYADIAVLIPTRTSLPQIEDALERAAVPYRVESRSLVYDTQEVRDLLSILRALDDPTDEVALVAALRSPAYGCGDDDLLRFYQVGGRWDYRRQLPEAVGEGDPVALAMQSLHDLHQRRWWQPINVIVEAVIRERRLFELAFAHRRPRERWQRLRFLLDQSRTFAEAGGRTLRQFIDWAELQSDEGTRVVETVVPEPDDDAVRIMTVHAAKGLEFPIVMLAGLNTEKRQQGRQRKAVLWDGEGRMQAAAGPSGGFRTAGYEAADVRERLLDEQEKVRLLYVAATRARDHLLLSLHHKAGKESHASLLYERTMQTPELSQRPALSEPAQVDGHEEPAPFDDGPEQRAAWLAEREQRIDSLRVIRTMSATEIAKAASGSDDPNLDKDAPVEETPPWRRGRAGTALGRAVHAALQSVDLATGADLASVASAQAAAEGIAGRADEIARMVSAAIASPSLQEAIGGRYWREMYVGAPIEGTRIEGFIDLLYETDAGLVVVDYKTDVVPGQADVEAAVQRYRLQGATYALALQEALGQPVARCVFIFVQPGRAREREIDDLPAAIAEVRQVLAGV